VKKNLFALLTLLVLTSLVLSACGSAATPAPAPTEAPAAEAPAAAAEKPLKIAFFVSDLSNVLHQAQFTEARGTPRKSMGPRCSPLTASPMGPS
jgi:ABC-type sugar transport system substrate-binding protein